MLSYHLIFFFSGKMHFVSLFYRATSCWNAISIPREGGVEKGKFLCPLSPHFFSFVVEEGPWLFLLTPLHNDQRSCVLLCKMCAQRFVKHENESQDPSKEEMAVRTKTLAIFHTPLWLPDM